MSRKLLLAVLVATTVLASGGCDALRTRILLNKGNRYYTSQRYDDAIKEYRKILEFAPDDYMANYLVAMSNLAMYHPGSSHPKDKMYSEESMKAFEKLLTLTPPNQEYGDRVKKYYLSLLSAAAREDKAVTFLEGELKKDPNNPAVMGELAQYYAKTGNFQKTLETFEQAARLDPNNKTRWYTVGVVCWERSYKGGLQVSDEERQKLIDEGQKALDKALAIDPDYFEALSYKNLLYREQAKVYANQQNLDAAAEEIKKADATLKRAMDARKKQQLAQRSASAPAATPQAQ